MAKKRTTKGARRIALSIRRRPINYNMIRTYPTPFANIYHLGYNNNTVNGELLNLSLRIRDLEVSRKVEQNQANKVAVGVSGYLQTQEENKHNDFIDTTKSIINTPTQTSIQIQENKLKSPSKTQGAPSALLSPLLPRRSERQPVPSKRYSSSTFTR
jgi:hypothetical protein